VCSQPGLLLLPYPKQHPQSSCRNSIEQGKHLPAAIDGLAGCVCVQSPLLGFIDDVEFYFPADKPNTVEYR
jgi:hypothetical protein